MPPLPSGPLTAYRPSITSGEPIPHVVPPSPGREPVLVAAARSGTPPLARAVRQDRRREHDPHPMGRRRHRLRRHGTRRPLLRAPARVRGMRLQSAALGTAVGPGRRRAPQHPGRGLVRAAYLAGTARRAGEDAALRGRGRRPGPLSPPRRGRRHEAPWQPPDRDRERIRIVLDLRAIRSASSSASRRASRPAGTLATGPRSAGAGDRRYGRCRRQSSGEGQQAEGEHELGRLPASAEGPHPATTSTPCGPVGEIAGEEREAGARPWAAHEPRQHHLATGDGKLGDDRLLLETVDVVEVELVLPAAVHQQGRCLGAEPALAPGDRSPRRDEQHGPQHGGGECRSVSPAGPGRTTKASTEAPRKAAKPA